MVFVGLDDHFAEEGVGIDDGGGGEVELLLAGVLLDELEAELVVAEELSGDLENAAGLGSCFFDDEGDGVVFEGDNDVVLVLEFADEGFDFLAGLFDDELLAKLAEFLEMGFAVVDEIGIDDEFVDGGAGKFVFEIAEDLLADGHESSSPRFFFGRHFGDAFDAFVFENNVDTIGLEFAFVLAEETALGVFQDGFEVRCLEMFADDAHRDAADEFGFEAKVDVVLGSDVLEELVVHLGDFALGGEADLRSGAALADDFFQSGKGTADDEEDVAGVDRLL